MDNSLKTSIHETFVKIIDSDLGITKKPDNSLVTEADNQISDLVKNWVLKNYPNYSFFSEEDQQSFEFPVCILDPIDGTKELVDKIPECCVSLALMASSQINDGENKALIFNPFNSFIIDNETYLYEDCTNRSPYLCFVSRTEHSSGLYTDLEANLDWSFIPKGSIAYKLGLLASQLCDSVVSLKPKNVWDIAAGTVLCANQGVEFYSEGKRIENLDQQLYLPPLIWAKKDKVADLISLF